MILNGFFLILSGFGRGGARTSPGPRSLFRIFMDFLQCHPGALAPVPVLEAVKSLKMSVLFGARRREPARARADNRGIVLEPLN